MQQGDAFEWDTNNEEKLAARHGVDRYEAEQAARDDGASIKRIGTDRVGNPEYIFVGKTNDARILLKEDTEGETDEPRTEANRQT
jgi:uncharacterized DUF497 family protein